MTNSERLRELTERAARVIYEWGIDDLSSDAIADMAEMVPEAAVKRAKRSDA